MGIFNLAELHPAVIAYARVFDHLQLQGDPLPDDSSTEVSKILEPTRVPRQYQSQSLAQAPLGQDSGTSQIG
ncbi:MAG: hypothetical protein A3F78_21010 [Burkholderiales bacterium RIFCSPLOWO2_12_FULL_61_40]|nr:MAG: hypothetical protein A3F78_21010 [Burkholderiales bacterium RIFCSPLOWO2_12_FULL_61_40]